MTSKMIRLLLFLLSLLFVAPVFAQWQTVNVPTSASFRGLSVVNEKIIWASGTGGTVIRTLDGGKTWQVLQVPDAAQLDFRDVEAFDANTAYVLSIGKGEASRIYKTIDGGATWQLMFKNSNPDAFFDALAWWDAQHGIALSDPVNGRFYLLTTDDGGASWQPVLAASLPPALPNDGAFAASGTCLVTQGKRNAIFVSGGGKTARVYRTTDRGDSWTVIDTPLAAGSAGAGGFSLAFRDAKHGVLVGGDYQKPTDATRNLAVTEDGGQTWRLIETGNPAGFRSGVTWARNRWIAVGTAGSDTSANGTAWRALDQENYNAVQSDGRGNVWAVGPKGRVAKLAAGK